MSFRLWLFLALLIIFLVATDRLGQTVLRWRAASRRLGFELRRRPRVLEMSGSVDGVEVEAALVHKPRSHGLDDRHTQVRLVDAPGVPKQLRIGSSRRRPHAALSPEVRAFNELLEMPGVTVTGAEEVCAALLDAETRARLVRGVEGYGLRVENGRLGTFRDGFVKDIDWLVLAVRLVAGLGRHLEADPEALPAKLWRNAMADPSAGFRRRCVELLLEHYPRSPSGERAAAWALTHGHPRARLLAARLGDREGLVEVESLALAGDVETGVRLQALQHLGASLAPQPLGAIAAQLLDDPAHALRRWAIDTAATLSLERPLLELAERAETLTPDCVRHLVGGFRHLGGTSGEAGLLAMLERPLGAGSKAEVSEALASVGGTDSVGALNRLTRGLFADGRVKRAARTALETIRTRLGPRAPGRLSLVAESEARGGLSQLDNAAGLSLSRDETVDVDREEGATR